MNVFQMSAIALIGSILALMVKSIRPELAIGISLAVGILLFSGALSDLSSMLSNLIAMMHESGIQKEYILAVLKIIGISYLTQFTGELCKDCGQNAIAVKIELVGKIAILTLTLPILRAFLDFIVHALSFI